MVDRYRADWKDLVTRAKAAQGRWILGINAAPVRILETVNRRASNRWLNDPDGRMYGIMSQQATLPDGTEVGDLYVRWEWFNPEAAPKILVGPEDQRTLRVPRSLKVRINEYVRRTGETQTELVNQVLKKYVRYGTRLKPNEPAHEQLRATVQDPLWTDALKRAEVDGIPLVEIVRYELDRKVR
jgi:hypothetical protein